MYPRWLVRWLTEHLSTTMAVSQVCIWRLRSLLGIGEWPGFPMIDITILSQHRQPRKKRIKLCISRRIGTSELTLCFSIELTQQRSRYRIKPKRIDKLQKQSPTASHIIFSQPKLTSQLPFLLFQRHLLFPYLDFCIMFPSLLSHRVGQSIVLPR